MLDVQIGSLLCFLLYTMQEMPRLGGKRFAAWYTNQKTIIDEAVRWSTNVFWGYVGVRVLNPGLFGGVLIYLLVLGIVRAIFLARKTREEKMQDAIASVAAEMLRQTPYSSGAAIIPRGYHIINTISHDEKSVIILVSIRPEYKIRVYEIRMERNSILIHYLLTEKIRKVVPFDIDEEMKTLLENLKFSEAFEKILPALETHSARQ